VMTALIKKGEGVQELDRINRRISVLKNTLFELNMREESEILDSEIRKVQKKKAKVFKEINKLNKKIHSLFNEE
jgi:predicted  nucleic acid-binding Zn-ribbon protein